MPVEVPPLELTPGEYSYSHDWFERDYGSKPHLKRESTRQLYERLLLPQKNKIRRILEIGISEGRSVVWFLQTMQPTEWLGIDPWLPGRWETYQPEHRRRRFWHNMGVLAGVQELVGFPRKADYGLPRETFRLLDCHCAVAWARSQEYLQHQYIQDYGKEKFDLVIIDGLHHGWGALTDAVLSFGILRNGGLIIFDDTHRRWQHGKAHVHEAVNGFHMGFEGWVRREFENGRQTWLRKIRDT